MRCTDGDVIRKVVQIFEEKGYHPSRRSLPGLDILVPTSQPAEEITRTHMHFPDSCRISIECESSLKGAVAYTAFGQIMSSFSMAGVHSGIIAYPKGAHDWRKLIIEATIKKFGLPVEFMEVDM